MAKDNDEKAPNLIIKKVKRISGGHHGGAWKVAYADFVTAMMAFFLLLWLLSVTTKEQKVQIASYFAPSDPRIADALSGAGGVMGGTSMSTEGAMRSQNGDIVPAQGPSDDVKEVNSEEDQKANGEKDRVDAKAFENIEEQIQQAMQSAPDLVALKDNLIMDITPEGLRIQIVDQNGKPMFELGSAKPLPIAVRLLNVISDAIYALPNKISIRGHTDSKQYSKDLLYTNWELSSDRANASRRVMVAAGTNLARVNNIQGKADVEPLLPQDPVATQNRRISIIILKQSVVAGLGKKLPSPTSSAPPPPSKKKEQGIIYFP